MTETVVDSQKLPASAWYRTLSPEMESIQLLPAVRADIPRLAHIHVASCMPDNAISLYFPSQEDFLTRVHEMLEKQIGDPDWVHIKAVERETGIIAAWSSWVETTYESTDAASPQQSQSETTLRKEQSALSDDAKKTEPVMPQKGDEFDFLPGLAQHVRADTDRAFRDWAKDSVHMQIKALFTEPVFQRRGIGNALVRYGNKVADEKRLPILCQASPFGYPIYANNGFSVFGHFDADLREWAPRGKDNDKGWGNYRYRYMVRLA